jgi:hypothetical protein
MLFLKSILLERKIKMETKNSSRYLSRRSFLVKGSRAIAALGLGGMFSNRLLAQTDAALWPDTMELAIDFEIIAPNTGRYKRPYVAVWTEDASGLPLRTLALWVSKSRWIPDLRRWYNDEQSRQSKDGGDLVSMVSSPTRLPGQYNLVWDGLNDAGEAVTLGEYYVCVETAREHGPYNLVREKITLADEPLTADFTGGEELGDVHVEYRVRG